MKENENGKNVPDKAVRFETFNFSNKKNLFRQQPTLNTISHFSFFCLVFVRAFCMVRGSRYMFAFRSLSSSSFLLHPLLLPRGSVATSQLKKKGKYKEDDLDK